LQGLSIVQERYDALVSLFEMLLEFLSRLEFYVQEPRAPDAILKIVAEALTCFLTILALSTKVFMENRIREFRLIA
jgi:hypothetical protein